MEQALCHQFNVTEARLLGLGNMRHLVEAAEKPGKHQSKDYRILYEAAFCGKTRCVCARVCIHIFAGLCVHALFHMVIYCD